MMRPGRPRQRFRGALAQEPLHTEPLALDMLEVELGRTGTSDDDEVDPHGEQLRVRSEALTAEPLYAVSLHGTADPAPDDQAEPRRTGHALSREEQREVGRADAARVTVALRPRELRVLAESSFGAEGHEARCRQRGAPYFL